MKRIELMVIVLFIISCRPVINQLTPEDINLNKYKSKVDSLSNDFTEYFPLEDSTVQIKGSYSFHDGFHGEYLLLDSTGIYKHTGWGDFGGKYKLGKGKWIRDESILVLWDKKGISRVYYLFSDKTKVYLIPEKEIDQAYFIYQEYLSLKRKFGEEKTEEFEKYYFSQFEILVNDKIKYAP